MVAFLATISSVGYLLLGVVMTAIAAWFDNDDLIGEDPVLTGFLIVLWPALIILAVLFGIGWPLVKASQKLTHIMKGK